MPEETLELRVRVGLTGFTAVLQRRKKLPREE